MVFQHVASVMISLSSQRAAKALISDSNSPMTTRLTGSPERVSFAVSGGGRHFAEALGERGQVAVDARAWRHEGLRSPR